RPPGATDADVAQAQAALDAQADQQAAKLSGLDEQISEARAQVAGAQAEIGRLSSTLPMLAEKERLHQKLRDEGFGTSFALLDAQQELSSARNEKTVDADKLAQARAALFALDQQRAEAVSEFQAGVLSDLAKAQEKASELSADLVKADKASTDTTLRAPIAGVVEELAVHTVGGVVTPAQRLAVIVPDNGALEVEAELPNRDVGFVHKGDDASVKVATFNFTRYGMLKGKVVDISRDAVGAQDKAAEDSSASPDAQARLPLGPPTFLATIALPQDYMLVDGKAARLVPGMSVTAEIKTGRRTIMNYLLSPLARRTDESLHER
ncbi:MAG: HlyD family type I secretion periplasmic adaptor subunit, partial [Caulobacteraceae bacterium]